MTQQIYFDGGCSPNPGLMQGCVIIDGESIVKKFGYGTNNVAEWRALIMALEIAIEIGYKDVEIIGDSLMVINQAKGLWKIKKNDFVQYRTRFDELSFYFDSIKLTHTLRDGNLAGNYLEFGK